MSDKDKKQLVIDHIEWCGMKTLESQCYNCCLFLGCKNGCVYPELCQGNVGFYKIKGCVSTMFNDILNS